MAQRKNSKALIVGGGIGGLSAALALRQIGMDVTVFESVNEVKEVGAGVTIWPNAVRALRKLGVVDALQAIGLPAIYRTILTWQGKLLSEIRVDRLADQMGSSIMLVHRAALQSALLQALGEADVQLGAKCVGITQDEGRVQAQFEDGRETQGDLLIGADGGRSVVRQHLFGEKKVRYAGYTSWRGIASVEEKHIPIGVSSETWGRGRRLGLIPMNNGRMYWFAVQNAPEGEGKHEAAPERKRYVQELFRGWHEPIEAVLEATETSTIIRTDVYELELLSHWCKGQVTLLGDAAHAMTPNMGQGVCQAIEDAVVLGACLNEGSAIAPALQMYEARRMRLTNRVAIQSRRIGHISQLENPLLCQLRDVLVKHLYTGFLSKELEWILRYEA